MNKIPVIKEESPQALLLEALNHGDALATSSEEVQMLIQLKGVCVNARPRKDGRYQGYLSVDGRRITFYGKTIEEVTSKITKAINDGEKPKLSKKSRGQSPALSEWTDSWIKLYKEPNVKPTTLQGVRDALKPALTALGDRKLGDLTTDAIQTLLISMNDTPRMRDACRSCLNQCLEKATKQGVLKRNPCESLEIKKHKKKHVFALTKNEEALFIKAIASSPYRPLFVFLLGTGLRIGEALALIDTDFDTDHKTVSVTKNIVYVKGKSIEQAMPKSEAGIRTVPVAPGAWEAIIPIQSGRLFPYSYNAIGHALRRVSSNLGFNVTAHQLRHTYATRLEEAGVPPKIKQYLLGHASLDVTQNIYTDVSADYLQSKRALIDSAFDT